MMLQHLLLGNYYLFTILASFIFFGVIAYFGKKKLFHHKAFYYKDIPIFFFSYGCFFLLFAPPGVHTFGRRIVVFCALHDFLTTPLPLCLLRIGPGSFLMTPFLRVRISSSFRISSKDKASPYFLMLSLDSLRLL